MTNKEIKKAKIVAKLLIYHVWPILNEYKLPKDTISPKIISAFASLIEQDTATYKSISETIKFMLWVSDWQN